MTKDQFKTIHHDRMLEALLRMTESSDGTVLYEDELPVVILSPDLLFFGDPFSDEAFVLTSPSSRAS